jgi:hypothetical protein
MYEAFLHISFCEFLSFSVRQMVCLCGFFNVDSYGGSVLAAGFAAIRMRYLPGSDTRGAF